jgi:hypothetical protein
MNIADCCDEHYADAVLQEEDGIDTTQRHGHMRRGRRFIGFDKSRVQRHNGANPAQEAGRALLAELHLQRALQTVLDTAVMNALPPTPKQRRLRPLSDV